MFTAVIYTCFWKQKDQTSCNQRHATKHSLWKPGNNVRLRTKWNSMSVPGIAGLLSIGFELLFSVFVIDTEVHIDTNHKAGEGRQQLPKTTTCHGKGHRWRPGDARNKQITNIQIILFCFCGNKVDIIFLHSLYRSTFSNMVTSP